MFVSNRQFAKALLCFDLDYQSNSMKEISKKIIKLDGHLYFFPNELSTQSSDQFS